MNKRYPPNKPYKPTEPKRTSSRLVSSNETKSEIIYRDVSILGDRDDINLEEWFNDQDEVLPPEPDIRWWNKLSLQDIVDMAPPNTQLCDIILEINMPRHLEYIDVSFSKHQRDLDYEEADYQNSLKKYEKEMIEYEKEMIEYKEKLDDYDKWAKEQQIKNLEQQIKNLKKK